MLSSLLSEGNCYIRNGLEQRIAKSSHISQPIDVTVVSVAPEDPGAELRRRQENVERLHSSDRLACCTGMYRDIGLLPAPSAWSVTHDPFEDCREMRLRLKSNTQGDVHEGIRRFRQHPLGTFDAFAQNVIVGPDTGCRSELPREAHPAQAGRLCQMD